MTFINPSVIRLRLSESSSVEYNNDNFTTGNILTLSDHNRSPLSVSYDVVGQESRMADGTMRKNVVSKKREFTCSWDMLPSIRSEVVDGHADARDMYEFYNRYLYTPFYMDMYFLVNSTERSKSPTSRNLADKNKEVVRVFWTNFSFDIIKRYSNFDYWNITADFTEV